MNGTKPTISVIMPVYNVESYLRECLDSVRAQTFTDWECICVDDGSTDTSADILDEYAEKDPRFKVIKREHFNAGACRNAGLNIAQGECLSFLDSDDVFAPQMLEVMVGVLNETSSDIVSCRYKDFYAGDDLAFLRAPLHPPNPFKVINNPSDTVNIFTTWVSWAWDKLFRRHFIANARLRFQEIASWNDLLFVNSALTLSTRTAMMENIFVGHRKHESSIMATSLARTCFADAHLAYYESIIMRKEFRNNESLINDFASAALKNSRTMLLNARSYEDFCVLFFAARRMFSTLNLGRFCQENIQAMSLKVLYAGLHSDDSPFVFLRRRIEDKDFQDVSKDTILKMKTSKTYVVGNATLFLPRLLVAVCRHVLGVIRRTV